MSNKTQDTYKKALAKATGIDEMVNLAIEIFKDLNDLKLARSVIKKAIQASVKFENLITIAAGVAKCCDMGVEGLSGKIYDLAIKRTITAHVPSWKTVRNLVDIGSSVYSNDDMEDKSSGDEAYKLAEEYSTEFDDFIHVAESVSYINKKLARQLFNKALYVAIGACEVSYLAACADLNLDELNWARELFQIALSRVEDEYDLADTAERIEDSSLDDGKKWAKEIKRIKIADLSAQILELKEARWKKVGIVTLNNTDEGIHYMRKKGLPRSIIIGFIDADKKDRLFCWFHDYEGGGQYSEGFLIEGEKKHSNTGETYLSDNFPDELKQINALKNKYLNWNNNEDTYMLTQDILFDDDFMANAGYSLEGISAAYTLHMTGITFYD
tara:strand:- start:150 stop:1301 length:1152 start_codon:yes stop_codon:yes gene_type:complete